MRKIGIHLDDRLDFLRNQGAHALDDGCPAPAFGFAPNELHRVSKIWLHGLRGSLIGGVINYYHPRVRCVFLDVLEQCRNRFELLECRNHDTECHLSACRVEPPILSRSFDSPWMTQNACGSASEIQAGATCVIKGYRRHRA